MRSVPDSGVIFVLPLLSPGSHRPRIALEFAEKTTLSVTVFKSYIYYHIYITKVKGYFFEKVLTAGNKVGII